MQVNAKELRHHLSEYLERASRGHSLVISMRGKPVARLSAIREERNEQDDTLFGIWADRTDMSVEEEIRSIRRGREFR